MKNYRLWGKPPYKIVVVHGGPGAPGAIAPVARELCNDIGVFEPFQSAKTIDGQVAELAAQISKHAETPVVLIGWSWGATLSYITAAGHPGLVKKLVLVSAPPLMTEGPRPDLRPVWMERLTEPERKRFIEMEKDFNDSDNGPSPETVKEFFNLVAKADCYDPLPAEDDVLEYQLDINMAVGKELGELIAGGELVKPGKNIECPVTAIHGDYDPRGPEYVRIPLSLAVKNFKFILLEKCGHYPWREKYARDKFYEVLREEING